MLWSPSLVEGTCFQTIRGAGSGMHDPSTKEKPSSHFHVHSILQLEFVGFLTTQGLHVLSV